MADTDVTDLLADPDFVDKIQVIHRTATIDQYGENNLTERCVNFTGSVQPISGKALQRLPEALRIANVRSFWIRGEIIASSASGAKYPDLLVFNNRRYAVQYIFDWTNFGSGYCEGTCIAERPIG